MIKRLSAVFALCMLFAVCAHVNTGAAAAGTGSDDRPDGRMEEASALLSAGDYASACRVLMDAAASGSADALAALARGIILDQSLAEYADPRALDELSERFAEKGDPWGIFLLAYCRLGSAVTEEEGLEAFYLLERASETDDPEVQSLALNDLGIMFSNGIIVQMDAEKAIEAYEKAAALGNPYSMGNLAEGYAYGTLFPQDDDAALAWYEKVLQTGDEGAREWVLELVNEAGGRYLSPSDGTERDDEKARAYYELAAKYGDADALFLMGVMYNQGWGVERNMAAAAEYYLKALEAGNNDAAYNLAVTYSYGEDGVERDLEKGLSFFCRAAEMGNTDAPDAISSIASDIYAGNGFDKDETLAVRWYEKAAEYGSAQAWQNIASLCVYHPAENGPDFEKALDCLTRAFELGGKDAAALMYSTGVNLLKGERGLEKDVDTAILWFEKAAELGFDPAMSSLGYLYSSEAYRDVIPPDREKAIFWFEKAASAGNTDAMENLGILYTGGSGTNADYEAAMNWYSKAAEAADPQDLSTIKRLAAYINNIGVYCAARDRSEDSKKLAFRAFKLATKLGDQPAKYNLGKAYAIGFGTEADMDRADELLGDIRSDREAFLSESGWFSSDP